MFDCSAATAAWCSSQFSRTAFARFPGYLSAEVWCGKRFFRRRQVDFMLETRGPFKFDASPINDYYASSGINERTLPFCFPHHRALTPSTSWHDGCINHSGCRLFLPSPLIPPQHTTPCASFSSSHSITTPFHFIPPHPHTHSLTIFVSLPSL